MDETMQCHPVSQSRSFQLPDTRVLGALVPAAPFLKTKYPRGPFPPQAGGCTLPSPSEKALLCAYSGNVFSFLPGLVLTCALKAGLAPISPHLVVTVIPGAPPPFSLQSAPQEVGSRGPLCHPQVP